MFAIVFCTANKFLEKGSKSPFQANKIWCRKIVSNGGPFLIRTYIDIGKGRLMKQLRDLSVKFLESRNLTQNNVILVWIFFPFKLIYCYVDYKDDYKRRQAILSN